MNKIAVICTSYHKEEIKKMLSIVESTAKKLENLEIEDIYWIPGALEIPFALKKISKGPSKGNSKYHGYIILGIIEKGETEHGSVMGQVVIRQLIKFQTKNLTPIGVGIIGPGADPKQVDERIEEHAENATLALSEMLKDPNEWK